MAKIVRRLQVMNPLSGRAVKRAHLNDLSHGCAEGAGCEVCRSSPAQRREILAAREVEHWNIEGLKSLGYEVVIDPRTRKRMLKHVDANPSDRKGS